MQKNRSKKVSCWQGGGVTFSWKWGRKKIRVAKREIRGQILFWGLCKEGKVRRMRGAAEKGKLVAGEQCLVEGGGGFPGEVIGEKQKKLV